MSRQYASIAFTDHVRAEQDRHGSGRVYAQHVARAEGAVGGDPLTDDVRLFLSERDSFFLSTVSETGWPYVQHRGGPAGFLRVLDDHTLGWADFRGNLQYVSTGNLATDDRVAIIVVDQVHRARLKVFGHATVRPADADPALADRLVEPGYDAVVERLVTIDVAAYDWNCPQHITPRLTLPEIEERVAPLRRRLEALEAENARLVQALGAAAV